MNPGAKLESSAASLAAPRFANSGPLLFAGLRQRYTSDMSGIPEQWERFAPHIGNIPGQVGRVAYGVWYNVQSGAKSMDHLCAVEVSGAEPLPVRFSTLSVVPHRYAVFAHPEHVSALSRTVDAIFHAWLPASGCQHAGSSGASSEDTLAFFERYGEDFNPATGRGNIEVWVPVKEN